VGIAKSLNFGLRYAQSLGYEWVITLDDDTLLSTTYLSDVFAFAEANEAVNFSIVACSRGDEFSLDKVNVYDFTEKRVLITSGSVFKIRDCTDIGGFDERMFIDLVDFDFCTRARLSKGPLIQLNKVGMIHKVGNSKTLTLCGMSIVVYHHAPFRLYYQVRNVFIFARKHLIASPALTVYLFADIIRIPLKAVFFERDKVVRLQYILRGFYDGIFNLGGKLTKIM
jgi:rhamnosyltransferase